MQYSTLSAPSVEHGQRPVPAEEMRMSLYTAFEDLPDRRRGAGKRYPLPVLLCLLCLAKMAGQTSLKGATEWVRLRATHLASAFGLKRTAMPCQMTYTRLLESLDAEQLTSILSAFFIRWEAQQRCENEPSRLQTDACFLEHAHVAIDGKAIRATSREEHPVHQVSAYDVQTGTVLFQVNVQDKQNEISALKPLLQPAFVKGRILSLDAMHTQRELCRRVHRWGGAYILVAKDNQPTLKEDIADLFEDPTPDRRRWVEAETWNKGHGRLEHRHLTCSPDLNDWFGNDWAGIAQVFRVQRTFRTLKTGAIHHEVVYGLSSLPLSQVPPPRLLQLLRDHWKIENRLHWRRDVTLGEDSCQTRTRAAPSILACLNSALLSLMDRLGIANVPRQVRFFDARLDQALQALQVGSCEIY